MMRIKIVAAFAALIFVVSFSNANPGNAGPVQIKDGTPAAARMLIRTAAKKKPVGRAAQCKALDRCRGRYTWCDDKVFKTMKPSPKRDAAHEACVDKYRTCIKKNFDSGDLLFVRWFWPGECPR